MDSKACLTLAVHSGTEPIKGTERFLPNTISLISNDKNNGPTVYHAANLQVKDSKRRDEISSKDRRADL